MSQKFGRLLESLYEDNQSAVWNGMEISEWFKTTMGVRQGCTLSPYLFAMYINDHSDSLPGGIEIDGILIKALLFTDDVVLFAYSNKGH